MKNNEEFKCLKCSKEWLVYLNDPLLTAQFKTLDEQLVALNEYANHTSREKKAVIPEMVEEIGNAAGDLLRKKKEVLEWRADIETRSRNQAYFLDWRQALKDGPPSKDPDETPNGLGNCLLLFGEARLKDMKNTLNKFEGRYEGKKEEIFNQFKGECEKIIRKSRAQYKENCDKAEPAQLYKGSHRSYKDILQNTCEQIQEKQIDILKQVLESVDSTAREAFDQECKEAYESKKTKLADHSTPGLIRLIGNVFLTITAIVSLPIKWAIDYKRTGGEWTRPWHWPWTEKTVSERKADRVMDTAKSISKIKGPSPGQ